MEAGSMVRGERLCILLNPTSTAGNASLYDGATLVERSVSRVCTSSNPDPFRVSTDLVMGAIYREHR
jgi:hypothetical protein